MVTKKVTATGLVRTGAVSWHGVIVASHSSGTLKLEDSVGGAQNLVMDTFSFPAGPCMYLFPQPIEFVNGLYATVGGTLNCQLLLN